jgi:hypothetical protein
VIKKAGTYTVQNDLTSGQGLTPAGDCIDVAAPHVVLLLDGFNLTGNGTGVGLHVMPKAAKFFVAGFRSKTSTASTPYSTLSGWGTGAEFDANKGVMDYFQANDNAAVGILLNRATGVNVNEMSCLNNGVYGIWLKSSSGNQINISASHNNGNSGVYLGCSSNGPNGQACAPSSSKNRIFNHSSGPSKPSGNTHYGIAIDTGGVGNRIINTGSGGNGTADLLDNNPNCGTNIWHANTFNTVVPPANAGCIR